MFESDGIFIDHGIEIIIDKNGDFIKTDIVK